MRILKLLLVLLISLVSVQALQAQLVKTKRTNADDLLEEATQQYNNKNYYKTIQLSRQGLSKRPDYADLHFLLGRAYAQVGQYDSARLEFQIVLHDVPRYKEAYTQAINLEQKLGRSQEALCYADDALYFFPNDRGFMLRKLSILESLRYYRYSDSYATRLINKYPEDSVLLRYYLSYKLDHAAVYYKEGNIARAKYDYEQILAVDPGNKLALDAIYNLEYKSGNYENSLAFINRMLLSDPNNYEYLSRKASILEDLRRYPEAIEVSQRIVTLYPGDSRARVLNTELRMAAGRFYMNTDSYMQFQSVLETNPSNRDALNYVTGISYSRGLYSECLFWCNRALRYYPSDKDFLNKKIGALENLQKYGQAADIAEKMWVVNKTTGNEERFIDLKIQAGKQSLSSLELDSALFAFDRVLQIAPSNPLALNYSINILAGQKKYNEAITLLDRSLSYYPEEQFLLYKKAGILLEMQQYDDAGTILYDLMQRFPENERYYNTFVDHKIDHGRALVKSEEFDEAREQFKTVLSLKPQQPDAINYLINVEANTKNYDSALMYVDKALLITPSDKELLLKKSGLLEVLNRYPEAYAISGDIWRKYPYNTKARDVYVDQIASSGRYQNKIGNPDSALREYEKVLAINPKDTTVLVASGNIYKGQKKFDSALAKIDTGLHYYKGNEALTFQRAVILESLAESPDKQRYQDSLFHSAYYAADSVARMKPWNATYVDYANYLHSKIYRNMLTFGFLFTSIDQDNNRTRANIATVQYMRFKSWGTWATRFNYAGRFVGTGLQIEGDINYKHSKRSSSYGNIGISNEIVFPQIKLGYSFYRSFKNSWDGELGVRLLRFQSVDLTSVSFVAGAAKTFNDFYANMRAFLIFQQGNVYQTVGLNMRQYLNSADFLSCSFGVGNSPDDFSTNFQLPTFAGIATYNIGVGYQKVFIHRNTFGINGTWYNQKIRDGVFRNQYDIYVTFSRKF